MLRLLLTLLVIATVITLLPIIFGVAKTVLEVALAIFLTFIGLTSMIFGILCIIGALTDTDRK